MNGTDIPEQNAGALLSASDSVPYHDWLAAGLGIAIAIALFLLVDFLMAWRKRERRLQERLESMGQKNKLSLPKRLWRSFFSGLY
jgi:hypothetical protein